MATTDVFCTRPENGDVPPGTAFGRHRPSARIVECDAFRFYSDTAVPAVTTRACTKGDRTRRSPRSDATRPRGWRTTRARRACTSTASCAAASSGRVRPRRSSRPRCVSASRYRTCGWSSTTALSPVSPRRKPRSVPAATFRSRWAPLTTSGGESTEAFHRRASEAVESLLPRPTDPSTTRFGVARASRTCVLGTAAVTRTAVLACLLPNTRFPHPS